MRRPLRLSALLLGLGLLLLRSTDAPLAPPRKAKAAPARPDVAAAPKPARTWLADAETIETRETPPDVQGEFHRVRVVRSDFKYPFLRIDETLRRDPASGTDQVVSAEEIVADHLLVRLQPGRIRSDLESALAPRGMTVARPLLSRGLFLVKLPTHDAGAVEAAAAALREERGLVRWAGPDPIHHVGITPNDPDYPSQWALPKISMPLAWDVHQLNADVAVGVVDSGVDYTHPDLAGSIWENPGEVPGNGIDDDDNGFVDDVRGWDFYGGTNDPMDYYFHGTHCAGIIGAQGNNGIGVAGIAWKLKVVPLRAFGPLGGGAESDILDATSYAMKAGFPMTSNSYGTNKPSQAFIDVLSDAEGIGMLFVASAGNSNKNSDQSPLYPAAYPHSNIISVMATDSADAKGWFSNWGPNSVDLGAPGVSILSTMPNGQYAYKDGTSMAGPHVAGAAALLKSFLPGLTCDQLKTQILDSADAVSPLAGLCKTGARLNVYKALLSYLPGTIQMDAAQVTVSEGGGSGTLTVLRTGGIGGTVTVEVWPASNSALQGRDFDFQPLMLTWLNGNNDPKQVVFTILDDTHQEGVEDFSIFLTSVSGGATLGSPASTTVFLVDND